MIDFRPREMNDRLAMRYETEIGDKRTGCSMDTYNSAELAEW